MPHDVLDPELMRGSLDLLVLCALQDSPKYGYLIQQTLRQGSAARVKLLPGSMYPILHRLEAEKLVKSRWDDATGRKRKWYELTSSGRKQLTRRATEWRDYVECLRGLLAPILETLPAPVPVVE